MWNFFWYLKIGILIKRGIPTLETGYALNVSRIRPAASMFENIPVNRGRYGSEYLKWVGGNYRIVKPKA